MKKLLISLVLATVLSVCAFAVSPAVNVLTGTKDALNFENAANDYFYNSNTTTASYFTFGVQSDVTGGGRGKVYSVVSDMDRIAAEKGADTYLYYTLAKDLTDVPDRPVYLVFETYGKKNIGFWLGNSSPITIGALSADNTWIKNVYNNVSVFGGGPNVLKIQYATRSLDCNDVQYFDNVALYPYYKIDYVLEYPDGTNGATTTKYFFDASKLTVAKDGTVSGFPTSYTLESVIASYPGYNFLGWTTQKGTSTAVTSVNLANKDIKLYPIWEKKAYVSPVNVTVYLDEAKTQKITDVCGAGDLFKLPTYEELVQHTKAGKMPSGFRMNGKLYAPGKSVMLPEEDSVVFTAEYASTLHEEYGELIMLENFDLLENGTYICDAEKSESYPINPAYINPSWSTNKEHFQLRYGDSMNNLQVMDVDGNNMMKVTKIKASSMWPQFYIFNNGGTPDGLYTVVANYVIPKSELSHLSNINVRVYYSGKESSNVQTTVSSLAGSDAGLSVACSVAAAAGTDISAIPKIQFFATADSTDYKASYYVDSIAIYRKSAVANFKLSDSKTHKIFFTPGDEITLPRSYEIMDSIPDGHVLKGFKLGGTMYYEGQKYTTKSTDSVIDFEVVYEKRIYALKFETGKANGTIGEIEMLDGEKVNLPENGIYHPSLSLTGWKLKGSDKEFSKGEEFTLDADAFAKYLDGTDRLIFEPVFSGADFTAYGFEKNVVVPTGTPTLATLVNVADSLYYGVRNSTSPNKTDAERLSDMVSKGICPEYASLSKKATFGDAAVVLANALPESYYRELCFNVDINGGDEALKLVRAGIFNESTDFAAEISYAELCDAVEKLTDRTKRSVENKRTFFVLGDSLTEAYGPSNPTKGWPEFIENYFTGNMALKNYGIAGINTGTYFNPSHERATDYYGKMITSVSRGDYVIIALGTNDSTLWGRGDMTKDQSRANYYRLISEIKAQGGIPVLVGPVGRNETDENGNYKESDPDIIPVMQSVNEIYGVNVPIIDFKQVSFDRLSAMTAAERGEFYIDTVHYKAKGADMVAGWFEELVLASDDVQLEAFKYHFGKYTDEEPLQYITIDIGEKTAASNVRFAEINGVQAVIPDGENVLAIRNTGKNMLVEIVEKTSADAVATANVKYYLTDAENNTATKISLDSFVQARDDVSIRTKEPSGLRFKAEILNAAKANTENAVIEEYGFILSRNDLLEKAGAELTFDFEKVVTGVAYNKNNGTDIIFDSSDDMVTVFAGVLTNIPEKHYKTKLVCKTYTKISVGGETFVVYGEPVKASMYEIAKAHINDDGLSEDMERLLSHIIKFVEDKDIFIEVDDLYKD